MNKPELLQMLRDVREHYHEALSYQVEGKTDAAQSKLIDADETLLPLIGAAEKGRLTCAGSTESIPGQTIGERLRFVREKNATTHHDVLRVLDRPKSHQSWYSRVESGEKSIPVVDLKRLAVFYGVSIDQLVP